MRLRKSRALAAVALAGAFVAVALPVVNSAGAATPTVSVINVQAELRDYEVLEVSRGLRARARLQNILPDTTSSARYVDFDAPMMKKALETAGMKPSQFIIQNGDGSDNTLYTDAVADVANGAKVLLIDPED